MTKDEIGARIVYERLEGEHELEAGDWAIGSARDVGRALDVPVDLLDGPVRVMFDGRFAGAVTRSEDFEPFCVVIRGDVLDVLDRDHNAGPGVAGVAITGSNGLSLRVETSPRDLTRDKSETDLLIVEGRSGTLIRIA